MKFSAVITLAVAALSVGGCTGTSLDQIVEANHQQRIDESNAGRPVAKGARDGIGSYSADGNQKRITLTNDGETAPQ